MAESSSLLGELEVEVEIKAPAAEFYHMYAGRPHHGPHKIWGPYKCFICVGSSPPLHVSKATPGNVICTTESGAKLAVSSLGTTCMVAKERIEVVEPEKKLIKFKVLEGGLMEEFKSFLITIQVTPKQGGNGSIVKWHFEKSEIGSMIGPCTIRHPSSHVRWGLGTIRSEKRKEKLSNCQAILCLTYDSISADFISKPHIWSNQELIGRDQMPAEKNLLSRRSLRRGHQLPMKVYLTDSYVECLAYQYCVDKTDSW
ncbi:hypothetical protein YC2023_090167 [Brassica napus]